jgi:hypothetical protein
MSRTICTHDHFLGFYPEASKTGVFDGCMDDKVKLFPGELVEALCLAKSRALGEFQPGLENRF